MKSTHRLILFSIFVFLFLILGTGVVLFSQGWRMDLSTFQIRKVGAIYIRSFPKDAAIYVDGKVVPNDSWLLRDGTLLNGLFPRAYHIRLRKDGYQDLTRTLTVSPSLVSEMRFAMLIPAKAQKITTVAKDARGVWKFDDTLVFQDSKGFSRLTSRFPGTLLNQVTNDSKLILTENQAAKAFYVFNTETASSTSITTLMKTPPSEVIDRVVLNPDNSNVILAHAKNKIYLYAVSEKRLLALDTVTSTADYSGLGLNLAASRSFLAWDNWDKKEDVSRIKIYDNFLGRVGASFTVPGKTTALRFTKNRLALLQDDGGFYLYFINERRLEKLASDVYAFDITENGERIATLEHTSLEIFSLAYAKDYRRFRLPDLPNLVSVQWHKDDQHLLIRHKEGMALLDMDDLNLEGVAPLSPDPHSFYHKDDNTLYFIQDGALWSLKFPQ